MMLDKLRTESINQKTKNLDMMSIEEILKVMNDEDKTVPEMVEEVIPSIAKAVEFVVSSFEHEGRLIYIGAGTSGRLGILDAVECPPTFSSDPKQVLGVIAGGNEAFIKAKEGAEDDSTLGRLELKKINLTSNDTVVGLAASGRTPYVIGALEYALEVGAKTVAVSCNPGSEIGHVAEVAIDVDTGAEVLTGSTRLKAGTAQKLVLNMISTASMVTIGKSYNNLMVDLNPSNEKLVERSKSIVMSATNVSYEHANKLLKKSDGKPKIAIIMNEVSCEKDVAYELLNRSKGNVKKAIILGKEGI